MGQFCTERRLTVSLSRSYESLKVILPLLRQKALARDMGLSFVRSLKGLNFIAHSFKSPLFKISRLCLLLEVGHN
jgi:hypothetical protein